MRVRSLALLVVVVGGEGGGGGRMHGRWKLD